jgi:hypothetical protein
VKRTEPRIGTAGCKRNSKGQELKRQEGQRKRQLALARLLYHDILSDRRASEFPPAAFEANNMDVGLLASIRLYGPTPLTLEPSLSIPSLD